MRAFGFLAVMLVGCLLSNVGFSQETPMPISQADALKIAEIYIKDHFSGFNSSGLVLIANDDGDLWEVYFKLNSDQLGGSPMVYIGKARGDVVKSYMTQ